MSKKLLKGKRGIKRIIAAAMALCMVCASPIATKSEVKAASMRSAFEITNDMGAGWNLGNSLESEYNEEYWGNPRITKGMIDKIKEKGFKTLRVPVRWDDNYSDTYNYTISNDYMNRVEEVVNYGLDNGMYVIINVHHNDLQTKVSTDSWQQQQVKNELQAIWTQVGNRFKNYGDKLIFEVNNEPRCGEDWGGNSSYYDCVNQYNEAARSAIRAIGGNNSKRLVMLPTYCASSDEPKLAGWQKIANDDMIAVSIHAYVPFQFAYEGAQTSWNDDLKYQLKGFFDNYKKYFLDKGIPVVIGEFGATNMGNTYDREQYAAAYAGYGKEYGIPCIWWDNNRFDYGKENFGIFDRYNYSFTYSKIAENIVNAFGSSSSSGGSDQPQQPSDPVVSGNTVTLFSGEAKASNWGQAVTVATTRCDGKFDASYIQNGGYFYVEYSGTENKLELILQSMSGGAAWAKVSPSETGYTNGHYYAKFSYDNCVSAFGTSDFSGKLDQIHVGAQNNWITVYSVCYCYPN